MLSSCETVCAVIHWMSVLSNWINAPAVIKWKTLTDLVWSLCAVVSLKHWVTNVTEIILPRWEHDVKVKSVSYFIVPI